MLPAPRGWGNNCVTSRPLWGPSPLCRKSPWEETAGSAPFGRENTPAGRPTPAGSDPRSSMWGKWGSWGGVGRLGELAPSGAPSLGGACRRAPAPCRLQGESGIGRVGLGEKVGPCQH